MEKLSVIFPCWNAERFIPDVIDCLLSQTYTNWQAIFVDDQSTDNTVKLLQHYKKKDNRIKIFVRDRLPKGAPTCRNLGYELSFGSKYIIYFDVDDLFAPYCFEQRVRFMDNNPNLDFGIFPAIMLCQNDKFHYVYGYKIFEDSLKAMLNWTLPIVGWTNIYRYQFLQENSIRWDERLRSMQDSDINIQTLTKDSYFKYAEANPDYFYRIFNDTNTISKQLADKEHLQSHLYLIEKILGELSEEQLIRYNRDLKCYLLKFVRLFTSDKTIMRNFCMIPWVKSHWWYSIRSYICSLTSPKIIRLLFPVIERRNRKNTQVWEQKMNAIYDNVIIYGKKYSDMW